MRMLDNFDLGDDYTSVHTCQNSSNYTLTCVLLCILQYFLYRKNINKNFFKVSSSLALGMRRKAARQTMGL